MELPVSPILTPLKNVTSAGLAFPNNYSTGDLYGDVFSTKNVLDPNYDMNLRLDDWDVERNRWADEDSRWTT